MLCGRNTHHDKQSSIYSSIRNFISSEVQQFSLLQVLALLSQFYDPEHVASRKNEKIQS